MHHKSTDFHNTIINIEIFSISTYTKNKTVMEERHMLAYTYMEKGAFELKEKSKPMLKEGQDAIVKVTLASICA